MKSSVLRADGIYCDSLHLRAHPKQREQRDMGLVVRGKGYNRDLLMNTLKHP